MSRIKSAGVYKQDSAKPLGAFSSKTKAVEFMFEQNKIANIDCHEVRFFYYLTKEQIEQLSYSQAVDFETTMKFAIEHTQRILKGY